MVRRGSNFPGGCQVARWLPRVHGDGGLPAAEASVRSAGKTERANGRQQDGHKRRTMAGPTQSKWGVVMGNLLSVVDTQREMNLLSRGNLRPRADKGRISAESRLLCFLLEESQ